MRIALLALLATLCFGQAPTTRTVTLSWVDPTNPPGATYTIYRAPGICSGTPTFAKIATGITAKSYDDTPIAPGNYCYTATATLNGMESAQSNTAGAAVTPFAPSGLSITVK